MIKDVSIVIIIIILLLHVLVIINILFIVKHTQIKLAFQILSNSRENDLSSNCQAALVIITNREITMETLGIVATENSQYNMLFSQPAKVFVNSFINRPDGNEELELVCAHNGLWNIITPDLFNDSILIKRKVSNRVLLASPCTVVLYMTYVCYTHTHTHTHTDTHTHTHTHTHSQTHTHR